MSWLACLCSNALLGALSNAALACADMPQDGLARAVDSVRDGDLLGALDAARAEPDELRRAQAVTYVRHHAGDIEGALDAALDGLRQHASDAWLLERAAYLGLTLRAGEFAAQAATRLAQRVGTAGGTESERYAQLARDYQREAEVLARRERSAHRALHGARAVVLCFGLLAVCGAWRLARDGAGRTAR